MDKYIVYLLNIPLLPGGVLGLRILSRPDPGDFARVRSPPGVKPTPHRPRVRPARQSVRCPEIHWRELGARASGAGAGRLDQARPRPHARRQGRWPGLLGGIWTIRCTASCGRRTVGGRGCRRQARQKAAGAPIWQQPPGSSPLPAGARARLWDCAGPRSSAAPGSHRRPGCDCPDRRVAECRPAYPAPRHAPARGHP